MCVLCGFVYEAEKECSGYAFRELACIRCTTFVCFYIVDVFIYNKFFIIDMRIHEGDWEAIL